MVRHVLACRLERCARISEDAADRCRFPHPGSFDNAPSNGAGLSLKPYWPDSDI
jgi:hypothetical protein